MPYYIARIIVVDCSIVFNHPCFVFSCQRVMRKILILLAGGISAAVCTFVLAWFVLPTHFFVSEDVEPIKAKIIAALSIDGGKLTYLGGEFSRESIVLFKIDACDISLERRVPIADVEKFSDEGNHIAAVMDMFQVGQSVTEFEKIYEIRLEVDTIFLAVVKGTVYILFCGMV